MVANRTSQERGRKLILCRARSDTSDQGLQGYHLETTGAKKCRMCDERDETIMHILSECSKLVRPSIKKDLIWSPLGLTGN